MQNHEKKVFIILLIEASFIMFVVFWVVLSDCQLFNKILSKNVDDYLILCYNNEKTNNLLSNT